MENNVVRFIKNEQNYTKLFLLNLYLYKEIKLIRSPFVDPTKDSLNNENIYNPQNRYYLIEGSGEGKTSIFDVGNIIDYKNSLIKKIDFLYNQNILADLDWEKKIMPFINTKLNLYKHLDDKEFCYFYWFYVYNYILCNQTNLFLKNRYQELYSVMVDLLTNCCGQFEKVIHLTTIFFCEDEYYWNLLTFSDKNKHHELITNQWALILNLNFDIISYSNLIDINWIIQFVERYLEKDKIVYNSSIDCMKYTEQGKIERIKLILYYYIYNNRDRIKLFNSSFKKAVAQVKYRGNEKKKTLNIQISNNSKSKLMQLTSHYNMTQPKFIEMLIDEAYSTIKNKINDLKVTIN